MLEDLLKAYCVYNPPIGYLQGMNDLFVPILLAYMPDWDENGDPIDKDGKVVDYKSYMPEIFWCFDSMLRNTDHLSFLSSVTEHCQGEAEIVHQILSQISPIAAIWMKRNNLSELLWCYSDFVLLFKRSFEDPKACKAPVYIKGGMLGAAIVTLTNYPLSVLQQRHRAKNGGEAPKFSPKGVAGFYIDQLGSSIGFAATMGTLAPRVPIPKNSLLAWARQHALVNISNVGAKLCAFPVHYIRHGSTLTGMVGGYLKMVPGVVITGDATNHFKGVFGFMLE